MPNYVKGYGPYDAKIMVIAEAPGQKESELGIPLVGPTGQLVQEIFDSCGARWDAIYKTNVVKYQPPFNDFSKLNLIGVDLAKSIEELWENEIRKIRPNVIIAMGNEALKAVAGKDGILKWRGSIILANDGITKVVPTVHPAALYPKGRSDTPLPWVYKRIIQNDIQRAIDQSHNRNYSPPFRQLDIARNSLDVYRFFKQYEKLDWASNDIESINCIPVCTGFSFNRSHGLCIPLLKQIGKTQLTDMSRRELAECWKIIQEQFSRLKLIGQNYKYDEFKQSLLGFRNFNLISDVLLKTHTIFPELPSKSLDVIASLWTEEPYYKEDGKEEKLGKYFDVERFFKYNARDCCVTKEIDEAQENDLVGLQDKYKIPLVDFYYNYVMRKHKFYLAMENRGFRVDKDKKATLKEEYEELKFHTHESLMSLVGYDVNVKSYPQMYELLYKAMGFKARVKDPTSEDTIVALLANHCKGTKGAVNAKILETVLEERRVRDQLSRQINFVPDYDDRCKTSFKITGTETARTSTNILKKPIRPKKIGLAFHTISKHGKLAKDIRSMFIPDEGTVFISTDSSQAEARIVAVLSEDYALLKAFDEIDIHRRTAGLFFGYTNSLILENREVSIVDFLEKDGPERFTGKMFRHAGNYDMKKARAMTEFNTNAQKYDIPMRVSEWKAGHYLDQFHTASPKIRGIFHEGIREAILSTKVLINPFGRIRQFNGRLDDANDGSFRDATIREGYAYIPQSTVADLVQSAALAANDEFNGQAAVFIAENHDALVIQAPINDWEPYAKCLQKYMMAPIDFAPYCSLKRDIKLVIPSDVEVSLDKDGNVTNYAALRKVKI